jgi:hypothetical protein
MAVGEGAVAWGLQSVALGYHAVAGIGYALALGYEAHATDLGTAIGFQAEADSAGLALGNYSLAKNHSVAIGAGSHALGSYTYAYGPNSWCYGTNSMAFGYSLTGNVWDAVAINGLAWAPQSFACAWGSSPGEASIAIGGDAEGYKSFAAGSGVSWGDYSVTIGRGTVTEQHYQVILGAYNAYLAPGTREPRPGDPVFVIGNGYLWGTDEHRSNAFMVLQNGSASVQGGLTVEGTAVTRDGGNGFVPAPAPSLFKGDVSVQGVLRVPEAGDLSMGVFTEGTPP